MPVVNFVNEKKQVQVPAGSNLRIEAQKAGIKLYGGINGVGANVNEVINCHGLGLCGSCRVLITKGMENASDMGVLEKLNLKASPTVFAYIGNEDKMRLACQTLVEGDIDVITRPGMNLTGDNFFS